MRRSGTMATTAANISEPLPPAPGRPGGPAHPRRGRDKALAAALAVLATLIGLLVLLWAVLYVTKGRFLKEPFERLASSYTEREVRVAGDFQFYFNPHATFVVDGLSISNPAWAEDDRLFESRHLAASLRVLPLLWGEQRYRHIVLDGGDAALEWNAQGQNSWTFGDPTGKPFEMPRIRRASITDTRMTYIDPALALRATINVGDVAARGDRFQERIPFSGTGTSHDSPFRLRGALTSPNETLAGGQNELTARLDVGAGRRTGRLDITGTLPGATELEGSDLKLSASGFDMSRLFTLLGVAVPETRSYRWTADLTKAGGEWRLTNMKGMFGSSDIAGRMTVSFPNERMLIVADLSSKSVDMLDLGPIIGYSPERLETGGGSGAVVERAGRPSLIPNAPLRYDAIGRFDAQVYYKVAQVRNQNVPISNIALDFDLDDRLMKIAPMQFDLSGGRVTSNITIDARRQPVVTTFDIAIAETPLGRLFRGFGLEESGTTGSMKARIDLKGEGDTLHEALASADGRLAITLPRGQFQTGNIQLTELDLGVFLHKLIEDELKQPVQLNCGLVAFTVRDGVAAADPILIDTAKNVIIGTGGFSFKDESLDLAIKADAKTFSLFSGQSPVGLGGYFAAPAIMPVSPELLTRAGAGAALGLVASPLAAIFAFVDPGDAKSADCGPVLEGARASAQRTEEGKPREDVGQGRPDKS
jgi:uncharacterized protein involved in outer membrane biogenesis